MTTLQKLQLRQSEIREKINELLGNDSRTEEQQGELEKLTGEGQKLEPEIRAAIVAEPDPNETRAEGDASALELRSLIHDASPGRILAAVHARRNTDGREKELQDHFKVGGNELPHAMLEVRAQTQAPANAATHQAEGATVTADIPAETFAAELLKPQAAQAQIEFSREDAASFPSMSDSLGRVIVDATGFELDRQLLRHTTQGLLTAGLTAPGNPAAQSGFSDYRKALNDQVNGREAGVASDCRMLMGSATYTHADGLFRTADSELSALDWLMEKSGGTRVHVAVPAVAAKRQDAVIAKALGHTHAVMPVWSAIQLVTDEVTQLQKRLIILTAIQLFAFKVLRADGFARVRFQVAA